MNENDIALIRNGSESENTSSDRSSDQLLLTDVNSSRSSNSDDELLGLCLVSFYSADGSCCCKVPYWCAGCVTAYKAIDLKTCGLSSDDGKSTDAAAMGIRITQAANANE